MREGDKEKMRQKQEAGGGGGGGGGWVDPIGENASGL